MDIRLGALKLYRSHLTSQYSDRCGYWALRDISGDAMTRVVVISTDGADQAQGCTSTHNITQHEYMYITILGCCRRNTWCQGHQHYGQRIVGRSM